MRQDFEGLDANGSFIRVKLLKSRKAVGAKCIYRWKVNQHG